MLKLYWKIFLWFWLAMVVVSVALATSVYVTRSGSQEARFKKLMDSLLSLQARYVAEIYEARGVNALSDYLANLEEGGKDHAALYDAGGSNLLKNSLPQRLPAPLLQALQDQETHLDDRNGQRMMTSRSTTGPSGKSYIFVAAHGPPPFWNIIDGGLRTKVLRISAVVLAVALVCMVLAHYITAPILHLQNVSRRIATGDLDARVSANYGRRHDEIADLGRDFNTMAEQIQVLLHSQRQLLQAISHEIRSPLSRLTIAVGLAKDNIAPATDELLERIETEAGRMDQMLAQLLTLARLDGGENHFQKSKADLSFLLSEIVSDANFEACAKKCRILLSKVEPCVVEANYSLLRSALENVIRNAVRYTPESSEVEIDLRLVRNLPQPCAVIHVTDQGPGVPENELELIFQPFYRVASARERETGGVGLGLAITERGVRFSKGTVRAQNRPGGGLDVEIRLPVLLLAPGDKLPDQTSADSALKPNCFS
jgi:two-component system, OmpR family, sensor histidine kinase CpxA